MTWLRAANDRLLLDINHLSRSTPWLHGPLTAYARYGLVLFALVLVAGVLASRHRSSRALAAAAWAPIAMLIALELNQPLGRAVHEQRPYDTHHGMLVLVARTTDFSFPSDHAVMAGAVTAGLLLVSWRVGLVAAALGLLMVFTRVYVGAHYPWDVVAGFAFGAAVAVVGWLVLRVPLTWFAGWLRAQPGLRAVFAPDGGPVRPHPAGP
jgi:undecaprenyl-diphosphatase